MRTAAPVTVLFAVMALAACGADTPQVEATPTPESVTLTIILEDQVPLNGSQNVDNVVCQSTPAYVRPGSQVYKPEVVVKDASGTVLYSEDLTDSVGESGKSSCTFTVTADVAESDAYTVTLTDSEGADHDTTVMRKGASDLSVTLIY